MRKAFIILLVLIVATIFYSQESKISKLENGILELKDEVEYQQKENSFLIARIGQQEFENLELLKEVEKKQERIEELEQKKNDTFMAKVTAYSPLDDQNGINSSGNPNITATGRMVSRGIVAVDPNKIPYGTKLKIEGFDRVFIAADTGGALRSYNGYAIDVVFPTYEKAINFGVRYLEVEIVE